jgi:Na+/H+ antiporter NhaC
MQADNFDTMTDMIYVLIPSIAIALIAWYYIGRNGKERIVNDMVKDSDFKF